MMHRCFGEYQRDWGYFELEIELRVSAQQQRSIANVVYGPGFDETKSLTGTYSGICQGTCVHLEFIWRSLWDVLKAIISLRAA